MIFYMQFYIKGSTWREPQISKKYLSQSRNVFLGILRGPSGPRRAPGANHFLRQFFHLLSLDSKLYFLAQLFFGRKSFSTKEQGCTLACLKLHRYAIASPQQLFQIMQQFLHGLILSFFPLRFQLLEIFSLDKTSKLFRKFLGRPTLKELLQKCEVC